jgi:hypothetical protein
MKKTLKVPLKLSGKEIDVVKLNGLVLLKAKQPTRFRL